MPDPKPSKNVIILGIIATIGIGIIYVVVSGSFITEGTISAPASESLNESITMHIHPMLRIVTDGKPVTIPQSIGINPSLHKSHTLDEYGMKNPNMSPLHTHDSSGIIHVESTVIRQYTLGEFFDVWGVPFSKNCIMDRCGDGAEIVRMYIDGKERNDFREHILMDGEEIEIVMMPMNDMTGNGMQDMMSQEPLDVIIKPISGHGKIPIGKEAEIVLSVLDKETEKPMEGVQVVIGIERGSSMSTMEMMGDMFEAEDKGNGEYIVRFTPDVEGVYTIHTMVMLPARTMMDNHMDFSVIAE